MTVGTSSEPGKDNPSVGRQPNPCATEKAAPGTPSIPWDRAVVPTLAPVQALHHATAAMVLGTDLWQDGQGRRPPSFAHKIAGGTVLVSVLPQVGVEFTPSALPLLWELAHKVSLRTLVVLQAVLAQYFTLATSVEETITVSVDRILDYRGVRRMRKIGDRQDHQHGHRTEDRREIARELNRLQQIAFSVIDGDIYPRKGRTKEKSKLNFHNSRLIVVTDTWGRIESSEDAVEFCPTCIRYMPGGWIKQYAAVGIKQLGKILSRNLSYDPYRRSWELAMASWLTLETFPNNTRAGERISRAIETILAAIAQKPDEKNPARTRDRFDLMMDRMKADGYLADWGYFDTDALPPHKWLPHWLKRRVWMKPAQDFDAFYTRRNPHRGRIAQGRAKR